MVDNKIDIKMTPIKELLGMYEFYKTPDGEDCLPKTYYYTKYTAIAGSVFSVFDICCYSQPKTLFGAIARFGHLTLPVAAVGFVFGSSLCFLGQIRKKDDVLNHVIAGAAAGSVYSFKYNRVLPGHVVGVALAFMAGYHKYFKVHNISIMKPVSSIYDTYSDNYDWSIKMYDDPGRPSRA